MMCLFLKKNMTVQGSYSSYMVLKSGTSVMSTWGGWMGRVGTGVGVCRGGTGRGRGGEDAEGCAVRGVRGRKSVGEKALSKGRVHPRKELVDQGCPKGGGKPLNCLMPCGGFHRSWPADPAADPREREEDP